LNYLKGEFVELVKWKASPYNDGEGKININRFDL
jgi:hypothetical protein